MRKLLAPRCLKNSCRNVDSMTTGSPRPQNSSTTDIPIVFRMKYLSIYEVEVFRCSLLPILLLIIFFHFMKEKSWFENGTMVSMCLSGICIHNPVFKVYSPKLVDDQNYSFYPWPHHFLVVFDPEATAPSIIVIVLSTVPVTFV